MQASAIADNCLFSRFLDHGKQRAFSLTYPMPLEQQAKIHPTSKLKVGALESFMNYPCIQVYYPDDKCDLNEVQMERQGRARLLPILNHLKKVGFFNTFEGIRFEICRGPPIAVPAPGPEQIATNRDRYSQYFKAVSKHATNEREHRNTLTLLQTAVDEYTSKDCCNRYNKMKAAGATQDDLQNTLLEDRKAVENIREIAALISPDMVKFNEWTKIKPQASEPEVLVDISKYKVHTVQRIIRETLSQFQAPLIPNSFWDFSNQQWNSLVIVMYGKEDLLVLRFGKMHLGKDAFEANSSPVAGNEYHAQRVSLDSSGSLAADIPSLGLFLGSHLLLLDLSKPLKFHPKNLGEAIRRAPEWFGVQKES